MYEHSKPPADPDFQSEPAITRTGQAAAQEKQNMASPAQLIANRQNAALSTGPTTAEGKHASCRNATRHGLTGSQIVIPGEDASAYEELRQEFHETHNPMDDAERVLVDQIAANAWRLMRAQRVEAAFLTKLTEDAENPDAAIALAFLERPKDMARIHRYNTAAQNPFYKAMAALAKLHKLRAVAEQEAMAVEFASFAESIESESTGSPVGFVSYAGPAMPATHASASTQAFAT